MQPLFRSFSFWIIAGRFPPVTRFIFAFFLILPLFTLNSCLEGEEEIWINLDASGHFVTRYEIPSMAIGQIGDPDKIVRALNLVAAKEEGLTITKCTHEAKGSKVIFRLEAEFDNILDLLEIAGRNEELFLRESSTDPDKIGAMAGAIDFRFKGLRPAFDREIEPSEIFPAVVAKRPGMLGSSTFKYTIHLPAKVRTTNAHTISDDGKTVSWSFLLKDHFDQPMTMSLTTVVPIPWWGWLLLGLVTLLLAYLIWRFLIRRFLIRRLLKTRDRRAAQEIDLSTA